MTDCFFTMLTLASKISSVNMGRRAMPVCAQHEKPHLASCLFAPQTEISQMGISARVSVECARCSHNIQDLLRLLYLLANLGCKAHSREE